MGTPIFLNTLANKIHNKLVDTASAIASPYHSDPRDLTTPSQFETLWAEKQPQPAQYQESVISKMIGSVQEHLLITPKSQINYMLERMESEDKFIERMNKLEE